MTTDENKAIVRRFIKEVLGDGNIDLIDELLAANYVNPSMGVTNREAFKAMISSLKTAMPSRNFEVMNLLAEGDAVVFRGNMNVTFPDGKKASVRVITYYRLADGKIVEDEPISMPPLTELLSSIMPKSAS
jgi:predicted SnoaL-like aldol condensation-catalyzing enzyme